MPQMSEEDFELFQEMKRELRQRRSKMTKREGPDPNHRGVVDLDYVRPPAHEFPKMAYKQDAKEKCGYRTRIIESHEEQATAVKLGWLVATKDIHALLDGLLRERNGELVEAN